MVFLRETIAHDSDPVVVEIAKDALAKNQAWLDEWDLQNKIAMKNNVKKAWLSNLFEIYCKHE